MVSGSGPGAEVERFDDLHVQFLGQEGKEVLSARLTIHAQGLAVPKLCPSPQTRRQYRRSQVVQHIENEVMEL